MGRWGGRRAKRMTALTLSHYGNVCHLCGRPGATTADHLVPRSLGGDDSIENLRPAHATCNSARGNMTMSAWRDRHRAHEPRTEPSRQW